jgi:hypothetical protein
MTLGPGGGGLVLRGRFRAARASGVPRCFRPATGRVSPIFAFDHEFSVPSPPLNTLPFVTSSPKQTSTRPAHAFLDPRPSIAEQSFVALEREIEAYTGGPVNRALVDLRVASAVARNVALRDQEPARRMSFDRLAKVGLYDGALPARIVHLALATWFNHQRQVGRMALATTVRVSPETLRNAQITRGRMLKVLDHWFDDRPEIVAEVAAIRTSAGYQDLANDLEALADLYQRPTLQAVIQQDAKHYKQDDIDTARSLARAIFDGLGIVRDGDAERWATLCQRTWTLLLADYEEHRSAGIFLFRKLEDVAETYPSLVSVARRSPPPRGTAMSNGTREAHEDLALDEADPPMAALPADLPEAANG